MTSPYDWPASVRVEYATPDRLGVTPDDVSASELLYADAADDFADGDRVWARFVTPWQEIKR